MPSPETISLQHARGSDGGFLVVLELASVAAASLDGPDDFHGLLVGDLSKDDMLAIQPCSLDCSDEELGPVAEWKGQQVFLGSRKLKSIRVWSRIRH